MQTVSSWFLNDPRRLCVVGVWMNLAGFAASLLAVVQADVAVAGAALLLFLAAAGFKASGLERFRRGRIRRHRFVRTTGGATQAA